MYLYYIMCGNAITMWKTRIIHAENNMERFNYSWLIRIESRFKVIKLISYMIKMNLLAPTPHLYSFFFFCLNFAKFRVLRWLKNLVGIFPPRHEFRQKSKSDNLVSRGPFFRFSLNGNCTRFSTYLAKVVFLNALWSGELALAVWYKYA